MQVNEVMTRSTVVVGPDSTLQEAAEKMKEHDIGVVLPVSENDKLLGMLTDRDITVRSVCDGNDPWTEKVRDVMTPEVVFCFDDEDVAEAARVMKENQVRRLAVLNHDNHLAGVLSLGDLARGTADEQLSGNVLRAVSEPACHAPPRLR